MKKRKGLKYIAGATVLATELLLSGCGASNTNATAQLKSLEDNEEIEAELLNDENSKMSRSIGWGIESIDEFSEERKEFEELIFNSEIIYSEEFAAIDNIHINWNAQKNLYELTFKKDDNKFIFNLEKNNLINFLIHQTSCQKLIIEHDKNNELLASLTECATIKEIVISDSDITSLQGLDNLTSLEDLTINNCQNITDLSPVASLTNLTWIGINGTRVSDISPLANLTNLKYANLRCNEITNPEVLNDLEYLKGLQLEFNRIENVEQLNAFVERGLFSAEHAEGVIDSCATQRLVFASDDYQDLPTVLMITYLDSKDSYFVEYRNDDNTELVKYALTNDPFDFYSLTQDTPNCTGIQLANLPEKFDLLSVADEAKFDAMVIKDCDINNLSFVTDFDNLTYLCIENCPNLASDALDFGFLGFKLQGLKTLIVKDTNISDFTPTREFLLLEEIELKNNDISSYSFVRGIKNLKLALLSVDTVPISIEPLVEIEDNGVTVWLEGMPLSDFQQKLLQEEEKKLGLTPDN